MRKRIYAKRVPCGRLRNEIHLNCLRERKWYNTIWVLRLRRNGHGFYHFWEKRCLICGHALQIADRPFKKGDWGF